MSMNVEPWERTHRPLRANFSDYARYAKESFRYMTSHLLATLFVWMLIGVSMALPSALWLIYFNLSTNNLDWENVNRFTAFFHVGATPEAVLNSVEQARRLDDVIDIRTISQREALDEFLANAGVPRTLAELELISLPASMTVVVADSVSNEELRKIVESVANMIAVNDIVLERDWLARVKSVTTIVNRVTWAFALLFGICCIFVTAAAVRLAIEERLNEISVLYLCGSPNRLINGPFKFCGLTYGAGGGIIAVMVLALGINYISHPLGELYATYGLTNTIQGFNYTFVFLLIGLGSVIGYVGASLITTQRLKMLHRR